MLRTNLASRPFYNVRAVHMLLAVATVLVVAFTLFNVARITGLTASQRTLGASASAAEEEATRLRAEAAGIRAQINPTELQGVADAAREANNIIDRRAFSWTTLFAQFEATLPPDVRITAIRPRLQQANVVVSVAVESRRAEDLDAFMEALEKSGDFFDVLPIDEQATEEGLLQAVVEGRYVPPPREGVAQ